MRSLILAVVASSFAVTGCKKESRPADEAEQAEAPPQEIPDSRQQARTRPDDTAAAEATVEITPDKMEKFVAYKKAELALANDTAEQMQRSLAEAEQKDTTTATLGAMGDVTTISQASNKKRRELRDRSGLTERELDHIQAIVGEVVFMRGVTKQNQAALESSIVEMKKSLDERRAELSPEQITQVEEQIAKLEEATKRSLDATEARKKWGDAAVDAVLAKEDELFAIMTNAAKEQ